MVVEIVTMPFGDYYSIIGSGVKDIYHNLQGLHIV